MTLVASVKLLRLSYRNIFQLTGETSKSLDDITALSIFTDHLFLDLRLSDELSKSVDTRSRLSSKTGFLLELRKPVEWDVMRFSGND